MWESRQWGRIVGEIYWFVLLFGDKKRNFAQNLKKHLTKD